jgi:hypothetical protein
MIVPAQENFFAVGFALAVFARQGNIRVRNMSKFNCLRGLRGQKSQDFC